MRVLFAGDRLPRGSAATALRRGLREVLAEASSRLGVGAGDVVVRFVDEPEIRERIEKVPGKERARTLGRYPRFRVILAGTGAEARRRSTSATVAAVDLALPGGPGLETVRALRDFRIEDLLQREPVKLDTMAIEAYLRGKTVMITGAGGSIGSELCRQVLRYGPKRLVVVERNEFNL